MSSPPPGLPPEVFARTRVKAVAAELAEQSDPKLQAALLFELGALTELRLGDTSAALLHYQDAVRCDPGFRPPLFALARHLQERRDDETLLKLFAKITHGSISARDRASSLVDAGCLLEDQLDDPAGALAAFERALVADPRCLAASLMRERALLAQNHRSEASVLIARRAGYTLDPKLRSALAIEAARELAADGDIDAAVESLLTALALPGRQLPTLTCLAELALRYGRPRVAARAHEDIGALLAGHAAGAAAEAGSDAVEINAHFPQRSAAAQAAAYHYHRAALLRAEDPEHAQDALLAHERAAACMPSDVLLGLELSAAYQSLDALSDAQAQLQKLQTGADARCTAALQFELAELAERQNDSAAALTHLRAAHHAAPDAPAINAVLEDRLLDVADPKGLCDFLTGRIRPLADPADPEWRVLMWRSAMAADRAHDIGRALELWTALSSVVTGAERTAALRELHGLAARAGRLPQMADAAQQLLHCEISPPERSAVWRSRYEAALGQSDMADARASLEHALGDAACQEWAPHAAWLFAGLQGDHVLLALAHAKLAGAAESQEDAPLAAAHLAARGRALLCSGDKTEASAALQRALTQTRGNHYAAALLERCLLARGETSAAIALLRESAQAEADARAQQSALLSAGELAEATGQLELARRSYDEAAQRDPTDFAAQWARLRFAERSRDLPRRLSALRALAEREAAHGRPGSAHLELGEALSARGEFASAAAPLAAAIENPSLALEAAASAALMPRCTEAEALRPRALSELAEQTTRKTRRVFEHERSAELMHQCPSDARQLLAGNPPEDGPDALLVCMLAGDAITSRTESLLDARLLTDDTAEQAELSLHAARCRTFHERIADADAVVAALALQEDAPGTLAAALALNEALDAADDPDTRVLALTTYLEQLPEPKPLELRAALARALLDAGAAGHALALCRDLTQADPDDPSHWESLRVAARMLGDYDQVVAACDQLAAHTHGSMRAGLLEEAAAVLHERLSQHEEAERRLREVLAEAPDRKPAFERLHDVLVEREDLDGLLALLAERISATDSSDERVDLLYERARILRARGEREAALAAADQLLTEAPLHAGALGLCAEIHATGENWLGAVAALRRLAETELTPAQRRLSLEGCADFLEQKLGDELGAYRELEKLLAYELADFSVHVRMAKLAEAAGRLQPAAAALVRAAAGSRGRQRAQLERKAAALYASVEQPEMARAALRRALVAHPADELALRALYPQLIAPDERERVALRFVDALFFSLASEPHDAELSRGLVRTGVLLERPALTRLGLFALEALGQATSDELSAAASVRSARAGRALGLDPRVRWDDANLALLMPRELSPEVLALGQSLSAAWLEVTPDAPEKHGLRRRSRLGSREPQPLREPLKAALAAFGLTLADSFGSEREPLAFYPLRQPGTAQSWVIGRDVQQKSLRPALLRAIPLMAASRAQLLGIWADDVNRVRAHARLMLVAAGLLTDGMLAADAAALAPKLPRARRAAIAQCFGKLTDAEQSLSDLALGTVALGQRAALIACGDLMECASLGGDPPGSEDPRSLFATPSGIELLRFWLSQACSELLTHSEVSP